MNNLQLTADECFLLKNAVRLYRGNLASAANHIALINRQATTQLDAHISVIVKLYEKLSRYQQELTKD